MPSPLHTGCDASTPPQVAQQIHALLRTFAPDGQVEKTSCEWLLPGVACFRRAAAAAWAQQADWRAGDLPGGWFNPVYLLNPRPSAFCSLLPMNPPSVCILFVLTHAR